jgi:cytochrome P450
MSAPTDPIAAVTHPDPYPYYAHLRAERPLYHDDRLGLWVASSGDAVTGVLTSERCRVRPVAEPVPRALLGSAAGEVFGRLVRMNDGPAHGRMKQAVSAAVQVLDPGQLASVSRDRARALVAALAPADDPARLTPFAFRVTADVVATTLGAPPDALPHIAQWTDDFVRSLAPASGADHVERGTRAAGELLRFIRSLQPTSDVLRALAGHAPGESEAVVANAVGFLSQAYEATAGLIGNTLLALARDPELRGAVPAVVLEVLRHDPPVQNTRRFVTDDGAVGGVHMRAGDAVLVVLAAANRDPAYNTEPDRFDVMRAAPRVFTFGIGPHACPGTTFATTIAAAAVQALLASGLKLKGLAETVRYRPSVNTRIPLFGSVA